MPGIVQTPTPNLSKSIQFYKNLDFDYKKKDDRHFVSDGKVVIEINQDRYARAGIKFYKESWEKEIEELSTMTAIVEKNGYSILSDASGNFLHLSEEDFKTPFEPQESSFSKLGSYAGLSFEGVSIPFLFKTYDILGFKVTMGGLEQGWMTAEFDGIAISFMGINTCPHLFFNPSLTYFNSGKNLEIIEDLRNSGVAMTEEITHFNKEGLVDNVIVRDPGGLGFFVFND